VVWSNNLYPSAPGVPPETPTVSVKLGSPQPPTKQVRRLTSELGPETVLEGGDSSPTSSGGDAGATLTPTPVPSTSDTATEILTVIMPTGGDSGLTYAYNVLTPAPSTPTPEQPAGGGGGGEVYRRLSGTDEGLHAGGRPARMPDRRDGWEGEGKGTKRVILRGKEDRLEGEEGTKKVVIGPRRQEGGRRRLPAPRPPTRSLGVTLAVPAKSADEYKAVKAFNVTTFNLTCAPGMDALKVRC
jgi:hypothetical protein